MKKQRNMFQMNEQDKSPEKELKKIEASNLTDTEFKTLVIIMLNEFRGRIDKLSENLNEEIVGIKKGIETIKKSQT